jgi:hypothetical protein
MAIVWKMLEVYNNNNFNQESEYLPWKKRKKRNHKMKVFQWGSFHGI